MERLTIRFGSCVGTTRLEDIGSQRILKQLAAYEDIGLTPEQVVELDRLYREKCEEIYKMSGTALISSYNQLRKRNAALEIQVKKLKEQLKAKENS